MFPFWIDPMMTGALPFVVGAITWLTNGLIR